MSFNVTATPTPDPDMYVRRSNKVTVDAPYGSAPVITLSRESIPFKNGAKMAGVETENFILGRNYAAVATDQVTMGSGKTLTIAELAEAIGLFGDLWDRQDHPTL